MMFNFSLQPFHLHRSIDASKLFKRFGVTIFLNAVIAVRMNEKMDQSEATERFVRNLTENQTRLYGYIYSLLGDHSKTADVVQETNLVLWRKLDEFQTQASFLPWAFAIARFQVLAHLRDQNRDRVLLDAELVESMSHDIERHSEKIESMREALRQCLQSLTEKNRQLIEFRYFHCQSIQELAGATNRSESAMKVALMRIRRQLTECVRKRLATES